MTAVEVVKDSVSAKAIFLVASVGLSNHLRKDVVPVGDYNRRDVNSPNVQVTWRIFHTYFSKHKSTHTDALPLSSTLTATSFMTA